MAFLEEYTLLDELGQGGYATVYKVRHNSLGYIRAVRILNATIAYGESDKTYQNFLKECRLLLRLGNGNHPNIVHIYQPLLRDQKAIVEMDFVDGKDLFHYLEDNTFFVKIGEVMKLLTDIGSALAYCHEDIYKFCMNKDEDELKDDPEDGSKVLLDAETRRKLIKKYRVIHNDIHSGNIMRREDGNYVLLDFGLAVDGDHFVRSSRRKEGVPEFKAPEKWDNEKLLTTRSDIYSFGVVLYEFLAGRVPFLFDKKNSNPIEAEYLLGKAHKEIIPEPVFEFRKMAFEHSHPGKTYEKDYPDWLEELIMKCLAKDPYDRFKNGKELFSYVQEHSSIGLDLWSLQKENEELRNLVEAANASNRKVDGFVMDLQEQLKESHNVQEGLNSQITVLQNENQTLKNNEEALKTENQKLKSSKKSKGRKVWKYTAVTFVVTILLCVGIHYVISLYHDNTTTDNSTSPYYSGSATDNSTNQELISSLKSQMQEKETQIDDLTSQIETLNYEIYNLRSAGQGMVDQSTVAERDNTISGLRTQINKLNNTIKKKNKEIKALQDQLFN